MVLHVQPVAYLHAIAVHRQRLARQRVHDHQRDQLLGEMVGTVVVAAIRRQHRQPVGVMPGPHQVVAGRLARAVRAVRLVAVLLGERRIARPQAAVHLVRGHVQKAERRPRHRLQILPITAHRVQQVERAHDVRLNELPRPVDGAVHMALGRKVHHRARPVLGQQSRQQRRVADVALHEHIARVPVQTRQRLRVPRIGQLVQIQHRLLRSREPVQNEIGANKAGAARDENHAKDP